MADFRGKIVFTGDAAQVERLVQGLDRSFDRLNRKAQAIKFGQDINKALQQSQRLLTAGQSQTQKLAAETARLNKRWQQFTDYIFNGAAALAHLTGLYKPFEASITEILKDTQKYNDQVRRSFYTLNQIDRAIAGVSKGWRDVVYSIDRYDRLAARQLKFEDRRKELLNLQANAMRRQLVLQGRLFAGQKQLQNVRASRVSRRDSGFLAFSQGAEARADVAAATARAQRAGRIAQGPATDLLSIEAAGKKRKYYDDLATKAAKDRVNLERKAARIAEKSKRTILRMEQKLRQAQKQRDKAAADKRQNLLLGAGFPLLFGGGPGAVAGGVLGGLIGGFGEQIFFSAIGQQIDAAVVRVQQLGNALNELNVDGLEEQLGVVDGVLRNEIALLRQLGNFEAAQERLASVAAAQTATIPGAIQDAANATNILQGSWNRLTGTFSTGISLLGAPFQVALAGALELVNGLLSGFNGIVSIIGAGIKSAGEFALELIYGQEGAQNIEAWIRATNGQLSEAVVKARELAVQLNEAVVRNRAELELEQRIVPDTGIDAKLSNIQVRYEQQLLKINDELLAKKRELNAERTKENNALIDQAVRLAENNATIDRERALLVRNREQQKAIYDVQEKSRREQERAAEASARAAEQSLKAGERLGNQLEVQISKLGGLTELQTKLKTIRIETVQIQERINELLDAEQRSVLTAMNAERERLRIRQAIIASGAQAMENRQKDIKPLEDIMNERKALQLRLQYGEKDAALRLRAAKLAKDNAEQTEQQIYLELKKNQVVEEGVRAQEYQRQLLEQTINSAGTQMASLFDTLIQGTTSWNEALTSTLRSLSSLLFKAGLSALGGGDGEGFFSILSGDFKVGERASGGPVSANRPYLVGEEGPELFVPGRSGGIVANDKMGGGEVNSVVNVNISDSGTSVDAKGASQLGRVIESTVVGVIQRERRPGGILSR